MKPFIKVNISVNSFLTSAHHHIGAKKSQKKAAPFGAASDIDYNVNYPKIPPFLSVLTPSPILNPL